MTNGAVFGNAAMLVSVSKASFASAANCKSPVVATCRPNGAAL